ncbi:MAG: type II toxin-antitoxin system VapC family toxin [Sphingobacteriia bacterium]|nr:type II toxin-antitoxin system VapC family toxin [Sphingobacteriia bacterium]
MSKVVLDASAIIALIKKEPGSETVVKYLDNAIISAVNLAEVVKYFIDNSDATIENIKNYISTLISEIIPVNEKIAYLSSELLKETKQYGLSLGDRICIATGIINKCKIITADQIWKNLSIKDVNIVVIRKSH